MRVTIEVFAYLKDKLGWKSKVVEIDKDSAFLIEILKTVPELYKELCSDRDDCIDEDFIILVNGIHYQFIGGEKAIIRDGDTISIFPPAAGGTIYG